MIEESEHPSGPAGEACRTSPISLVLSIDLDVFVDPPLHWVKDDSPRPKKGGFRIAKAREVEDFMCRCNLYPASPTRGVVVEHHVELFHWLRKMIDNRSLTAPFDLVHADAHADMAAGVNSTPHRIMTHVLHRPSAERVGLAAGQVTSADWLAWAVACGWLRSIVHVRRDADPTRARDYPPCWFHKRDHASGIMEMVVLTREEFLCAEPKPTHTEPQVAFSTCDLDTYRASSRFDFVAVCHSPAFVPRSGDVLLRILQGVVQST